MTDVNTLGTEDQNTNTTDEQVVTDTPTTVEDVAVTDSNTNIDVDSMSDEEFVAFMDSTPTTVTTTKDTTSTKQDTTTDEVKGSKTEETTKVEQTPVTKVKEAVKAVEDTNSTTTTIPDNYADIFKPFKANGKEITPKTVDDVVSLMQMGANYTKKMQAMVPLKRTVETLNKADIKEEDLNFLIDVHKGDKEAIKKLLEKHKVDPLELDMETTNYVPKNNMISEEDIEYLSTLEDIQSSVPKISEIISTKWDAESKQILLKDPKALIGLHQEIELGRFDEIQAQLEVDRTFGRYKGVSDFQAYIDIVNKKVATQVSKPTVTPTVSDAVSTPTTKPKTQHDKSKAAPAKGTATSRGSAITTKDLINTSDEEFLKLMARGLA